jgi:hypothetical protein
LAGKAAIVVANGIPITAFYSAKSKQGLGLRDLASRGGHAYDSSPNFKFLKNGQLNIKFKKCYKSQI